MKKILLLLTACGFAFSINPYEASNVRPSSAIERQLEAFFSAQGSHQVPIEKLTVIGCNIALATVGGGIALGLIFSGLNPELQTAVERLIEAIHGPEVAALIALGITFATGTAAALGTRSVLRARYGPGEEDRRSAVRAIEKILESRADSLSDLDAETLGVLERLPLGEASLEIIREKLGR
jgi:hypothetical protein